MDCLEEEVSFWVVIFKYWNLTRNNGSTHLLLLDIKPRGQGDLFEVKEVKHISLTSRLYVNENREEENVGSVCSLMI